MDYDEYDDYEPEPEERRRDPKVDEAKAELTEFFKVNHAHVYYQRQLTILFEKKYFHWITSKALKELVNESVIASAPVAPKNWAGRPMSFYFALRNRYWKREANRISKLVARFSISDFGQALGNHGEQMVDAALPRAQLLPIARNAREYRGKKWERTQHDLDRIFERAGIGYGIEVKNTLDYIPPDELKVKMEMCAHLDLVPIFIVRMAPASYIHRVHVSGGFTLVLKYQLYPFGQEAFAKEVRDALGLPVDCPKLLADGTVQRLANFCAEKEQSVNSDSNSHGKGAK